MIDQRIRMYIFADVLTFTGLIVLYFYFKNAAKEKKEITILKAGYDHAIKEGNKDLALEPGRKYYSALRGGVLSVYDEQAITNDLSTIK